jgi:hypothetical protein
LTIVIRTESELFENQSLDNVLGHLYGPGDGKTFDGVISKDLSNPIRDGPSSAPTARWCPHRRRGLPQPRLEVSGPADASSKLTRDTSLAAYLV